MPLTRCSSASWSTSGLSVLPGGRRCRGSGLALGGGLLAGRVRSLALGRLVLGPGAPGGSALGPTVLGGRALGRVVLRGTVPGSAVLGAVLGRGVLGGGVAVLG